MLLYVHYVFSHNLSQFPDNSLKICVLDVLSISGNYMQSHLLHIVPKAGDDWRSELWEVIDNVLDVLGCKCQSFKSFFLATTCVLRCEHLVRF